MLLSLHKKIKKDKKIVTIKDVKKEIKHIYEHPLERMYRINPVQTYFNIIIFCVILIIVILILDVT